ncbi:MAG: TadE/TadG family type IV pilus assembly protein [Gemmatimonadota bacterium]
MTGEIRTPLHACTREERGQSLVEFAIALPLLLAIVIGIFEFGMAWNQRQVITNAAREGARVLALPQAHPDSANTIVGIYLTSANLDPSLATITADEGANGGTIGNFATVGVSYPYQFTFIGPIVAMLQGSDAAMQGTIQLQTTAVMRNE